MGAMNNHREASNRYRAIRDMESARDALEHPGVVRVAAMLHTPKWHYDPSPETQSELVDAIDAIPRFIRRCLFGLPARLDPLYPVACAMYDASLHDDTIDKRSASLSSAAWLYGISKQRAKQIEVRALQQLRRDPRVKSLRCHLEDGIENWHSANRGASE